jgi:hypothetical protein
MLVQKKCVSEPIEVTLELPIELSPGNYLSFIVVNCRNLTMNNQSLLISGKSIDLSFVGKVDQKKITVFQCINTGTIQGKEWKRF